MFLAVYVPLRLPALTVLWAAMTGVLLYASRCEGAPQWLSGIMWLFAIALVLKVLNVDLLSWGLDMRTWTYAGDAYNGRDAAMRFLDFGVLIGFLSWAAVSLLGDTRSPRQVYVTAAILLLFVYATLETNTCLGAFVPGLRAGGISILWSVFALGGVIQGIRRDSRVLRPSGLFLFAVVALKVYFSDLGALSAAYRMIALLILGAILLIGSVIYLRNPDAFRTGGDDESG
jgi:hypothetical protein